MVVYLQGPPFARNFIKLRPESGLSLIGPKIGPKLNFIKLWPERGPNLNNPTYNLFHLV